MEKTGSQPLDQSSKLAARQGVSFVTMTAQQIKATFGTKAEMYRFMTYGAALYLPPVSTVSGNFLALILMGRKLAYKANAISRAQVPHFDELSVQAILTSLKDVKYAPYLPDGKAFRKVPRWFVFDILRTTEIIAFDHAVKLAIAERNKRITEIVTPHVSMLHEFAEVLKTYPIRSSKKGRMHMYFKDGAKFHKRSHTEMLQDLKKAQELRAIYQAYPDLKTKFGERLEETMNILAQCSQEDLDLLAKTHAPHQAEGTGLQSQAAKKPKPVSGEDTKEQTTKSQVKPQIGSTPKP